MSLCPVSAFQLECCGNSSFGSFHEQEPVRVAPKFAKASSIIQMMGEDSYKARAAALTRIRMTQSHEFQDVVACVRNTFPNSEKDRVRLLSVLVLERIQKGEFHEVLAYAQEIAQSAGNIEDLTLVDNKLLSIVERLCEKDQHQLAESIAALIQSVTGKDEAFKAIAKIGSEKIITEHVTALAPAPFFSQAIALVGNIQISACAHMAVGLWMAKTGRGVEGFDMVMDKVKDPVFKNKSLVKVLTEAASIDQPDDKIATLEAKIAEVKEEWIRKSLHKELDYLKKAREAVFKAITLAEALCDSTPETHEALFALAKKGDFKSDITIYDCTLDEAPSLIAAELLIDYGCINQAIRAVEKIEKCRDWLCEIYEEIAKKITDPIEAEQLCDAVSKLDDPQQKNRIYWKMVKRLTEE
jgi:hypothetical protein